MKSVWEDVKYRNSIHRYGQKYTGVSGQNIHDQMNTEDFNDKCLDYLTFVKQGLISREHVMCFDIWIVVIFQQLFLFRKLDFVKWNFYLNDFRQFKFNFLQKYKMSSVIFSSLSVSTPAHSSSLHLGITLCFCLRAAHACQDIHRLTPPLMTTCYLTSL